MFIVFSRFGLLTYVFCGMSFTRLLYISIQNICQEKIGKICYVLETATPNTELCNILSVYIAVCVCLRLMRVVCMHVPLVKVCCMCVCAFS